MISVAGHEVVRLPVAHCTLNPIEMAWAQVKGHIKSNTKKFNLTEVEQLAWQDFGIVTADDWRKLVEHVRDKVEDHYWTSDGLYQQYVEQFIIHFNDGDNDNGNVSSSTDGFSGCDEDSDIANSTIDSNSSITYSGSKISDSGSIF